MFDYTNFYKDDNEQVEDVIEDKNEQIVDDSDDSEDVVDNTEITMIGIVAVDLLNVRSSMDANSDNIVAKVKKDSELLIVNDFFDWYEICTASGVDGYVMKRFVRV